MLAAERGLKLSRAAFRAGAVLPKAVAHHRRHPHRECSSLARLWARERPLSRRSPATSANPNGRRSSLQRLWAREHPWQGGRPLLPPSTTGIVALSRGYRCGSGPSQGGRPCQGSIWRSRRRPTFRIWDVTTGKPPLDTAGLDLDRDRFNGQSPWRGVGEKLEFFSRKLRPHFKFLKRSFPPLNTHENICGIQTPSCRG